MDNPVNHAIFAGMTLDHDILIVGGALNGPALALATAQAGFSVGVIDTVPLDTYKDPAFDGRAYALALASQRLLKGIGIWPSVAEHAEPMLEIKVTDGIAGQGAAPWMLHFDHAEIEEGPMGYMVEDRHLRPAFMDAIEENDRITVYAPETVVAQKVISNGIAITLASGRTLTASLLVGCDGRRSGTAERAGIKRTGWSYGQTGIVCAVAHELPHNGVAHQFFMPHGPLAILPLKGNRSSIVWSETDERAAECAAMDDETFLEVLKPAFGSFLGPIKLEGKRFNYPLNLTLANSFIADRVALVGDAAHGMHPIAGQGLNAGLRDIAALADVLRDARHTGQDIGNPIVLQKYQQWRRFDTATLAAATDTFNKLFSNDNPLLRAVRDAGMGIINSVPKLRRGFVREAAGLTGDLPSLMR